MVSITARWAAWDGTSMENLVLTETHGIHVESVIIGTEAGSPYALAYKIRCDPAGRVVRLDARVIGTDRSIALRSDGAGRWTDESGLDLPQFSGAIDVDITATPFTNTLPIRRLGLAQGANAVITPVYVSAPDLTLSIDEQRYTAISPYRWLFEAVDGSFTREIEVDDRGLVVNYPGLFRRVA